MICENVDEIQGNDSDSNIHFHILVVCILKIGSMGFGFCSKYFHTTWKKKWKNDVPLKRLIRSDSIENWPKYLRMNRAFRSNGISPKVYENRLHFVQKSSNVVIPCHYILPPPPAFPDSNNSQHTQWYRSLHNKNPKSQYECIDFSWLSFSGYGAQKYILWELLHEMDFIILLLNISRNHIHLVHSHPIHFPLFSCIQ